MEISILQVCAQQTIDRECATHTGRIKSQHSLTRGSGDSNSFNVVSTESKCSDTGQTPDIDSRQDTVETISMYKSNMTTLFDLLVV